MPLYEYICYGCDRLLERIVPVEERDAQWCDGCDDRLRRVLSVPAQAQFRGRVVQGGGPDRFTADALGVPLKDLPEGLKTK